MNQVRGLVLDSAAPLDDGLRGFNKLYFAFGLIGLIIGIICNGMKSGLFLLLVGVVIAFVIKAIIAKGKLDSLCFIEFNLSAPNVNLEYLMKLIVKPLTVLGMTVEKKTDGTPLVTYNGLQYNISLTKSNTFTIDCRIPLTRRLFHYSVIPFYKKAVVSIGLIAYTIQVECDKYVDLKSSGGEK